MRTGRAYVEDFPSPHGMKISEPETSSTKARNTQFQVLETFIFGHYLMLPR